jgi:hypothetical protein
MLDMSNPVTRPLSYCIKNVAVLLYSTSYFFLYTRSVQLISRLLKRHISKLSPISDLISEVCRFQRGTKLYS